MFFATDLDRTLIYSDKFLGGVNSPYKCIETHEGREISYISTEGLEKLIELYNKMPIVPITTRNLKQYKRIRVFQDFITPETYSVNNGGTIIHKGQEDLRWKQIIKDKIEKLTLTYEDVIDIFTDEYNKPIKRFYKSDGLIWVIIGERNNIDEDAITRIREILEPHGWDVPVNGKKMYMLPRFINKWDAVNYIKENYYTSPIISAGDSQFDKEMVIKADYGIVPRRAYIEDEINKNKVFVTKHEGIRATVNILEYLDDIFNKMDMYENIK